MQSLLSNPGVFTAEAMSLGLSYALAVVGFVVLICGFICFVGAFCQVPRTYFHGALIAVCTGVFCSFVLVALVRLFLPELAAAFTLWGLSVFSFTISTVVLSVPLLQFFWKTSYTRVFASIFIGILMFLGVFTLIQWKTGPAETWVARPGMPLFQNAPSR